MALATLAFVALEAALFLAAIALVGRRGRSAEERCLLIAACEIALEASLAGLFSFSGTNSRAAYSIAAAVCAILALAFPSGRRAIRAFPRTVRSLAILRARWPFAIAAALATPLALLSFHPVDEIDSINYLHYLIEWMANRATPYNFATYYVAFWELSFVPTWMVTGYDLFFPLLALKSLAVLAGALWLLGREFRLSGVVLAVTVASGCALRHMWQATSGVPTLKNDTLHAAGFVLLALIVVRAARRRLQLSDLAVLTAGVVFVAVKYLGPFIVPIALVAILWLARKQVREQWRAALAASGAIALVALATSWHYYLHHLIVYGSPFYPVQINFGPIHLPGLADLSNTSLLYNWREAELWRIFFVPASGIPPAGMMFPLVLALTLILSVWRCARFVVRRTRPSALDAAAFLILCGWLLYFRSALGAGGGPGQLNFIRGDMNSLRYAEGVLAASLLFLAGLFPRIAPGVIGANLASQLLLLYSRIPASVWPLSTILIASLTTFAVFAFVRRHRALLLATALVIAAPLLVEQNRVLWTPFWNDLKPTLAQLRTHDLSVLALTDGGYFAAQAVAAGNPVDTSVRAPLPEEMEKLAPAERPMYLAVLFSPGSEGENIWRARSLAQSTRWGYSLVSQGQNGLILRRR